MATSHFFSPKKRLVTNLMTSLTNVTGLYSLTSGPDNIIRRLQDTQKEVAVVLSNRQRQKGRLTINVFFTLNLQSLFFSHNHKTAMTGRKQ